MESHVTDFGVVRISIDGVHHWVPLPHPHGKFEWDTQKDPNLTPQDFHMDKAENFGLASITIIFRQELRSANSVANALVQ